MYPIRLRSMYSAIPAKVRFLNGSGCDADVLWIDYMGNIRRYATVHPGGWLDVDTFVDHPWTFREHRTGDPLLCLNSGQTVYVPARLSNEELPKKRIVTVCRPGYSLKALCVRALREFLSVDGVERLCIPPRLRKELIMSVIRFQRYQMFNRQVNGYQLMLVG